MQHPVYDRRHCKIGCPQQRADFALKVANQLQMQPCDFRCHPAHDFLPKMPMGIVHQHAGIAHCRDLQVVLVAQEDLEQQQVAFYLA